MESTANQKNRKPDIVIQPGKGLLSLDLRAIWEHRELLVFLIWRDVKVRYKQTAIGASWAILQPVLTMVIFTIIFGTFAKIPSDGIPYPLFAYSALLPWTFFAQAFGRIGNSVVNQRHLITKIYFPRLILPLAATGSPALDFLLSFSVLFILMGWYGVYPPWWSIVILPFFILFLLISALAVGLWLAPLNVKYRDISFTIPFLIQIWMYCSPVVYPISLVPGKWRMIYSLNPMAGVIEGFRWALLGKESPAFGAMAISVGVIILILLGGIVFFKRMERNFADII